MAPIPGFPGYHATDDGRIWSDKSQRHLKPHTKPNGYQLICLQDAASRGRSQLVSRAICTAFHGQPFYGAHAAHLDGDLANNAPANLAWVTSKENNAHKVLHGTVANGEKSGKSKLTVEQVQEIRRQYDGGILPRIIGERFGITDRHAADLGRRVSWSWLDEARTLLGDS